MKDKRIRLEVERRRLERIEPQDARYVLASSLVVVIDALLDAGGECEVEKAALTYTTKEDVSRALCEFNDAFTRLLRKQPIDEKTKDKWKLQWTFQNGGVLVSLELLSADGRRCWSCQHAEHMKGHCPVEDYDFLWTGKRLIDAVNQYAKEIKASISLTTNEFLWLDVRFFL